MADPVDAARASANDDEDVEDLYADLDEQVTAALAAAGESGGSNARDSEPATDGEGEVPEDDANEVVDLGDGTAGYSSSDEESDDGLRIVLNEDAGAPLPPPPAGRGERCVVEDEEGEDSGSRAKGPSVSDGGRGKLGGLQSKGLIEKTTAPVTGQGDRSCHRVFQRDSNFFLARNRTIFDINIEALQQKPWRQHGIDLTDYFNFGLDEEGWRKYWLSMRQLRQGTRSFANESSGQDQESYKLESIRVAPKASNYPGFTGKDGLLKPKGRAIRVEGSVCERVPSADLWRPIERDSDVVIEVNMMHSPSNQSTSDDSSTLNPKLVTTESACRTSIEHLGDKSLENSSIVVEGMVDKEVHYGGSSEYTGSEIDRRDSAHARDQSSSPGDSDMLSEESKEDMYFKRANRHSDSRDFYGDTKLMNEHTKSDLHRHLSKSYQENSESNNRSRSYTPCASDDKYHKATKLLSRDDASTGRGRSINCKSGRHHHKSGHRARKKHKRQSSAAGTRAGFDEQDKSTVNYPRSVDRKYEQRRCSSTSPRNNYPNAVHSQFSDEQNYSRLERIALRDDKHCFSNDCESNHYHRPSSWREFREGEGVMDAFSSAKDWQQHRDHGYHSELKADISNENHRRMYRERYRETRRFRHSHSGDDEFLHYDYRFSKLQSPYIRGKYSNRGSCAKSNDEHLALYPRANLKNSERDWPAAGLTFMSSRNRCIDNKRIHNAKMVQYHYDGHHQKSNHHDSPFCVDIPQSVLCTDDVAETGRCIMPVKRKFHADLRSMNREDLAGLSLHTGKRLIHDQSMVSDRKIFAVKHRSSKETDTEDIFYSNDMRNRITVSNICVERGNELGNTDNIHLNDRKRKFKRRGNELIREVENNSEGCLSVGDMHGSKHQKVQKNSRKRNRRCGHSSNQDLEKAHQRQQNEDAEIEEGELIEQDLRDAMSKSKPRKVILKPVLETSPAEQLQVTMPRDAACRNGAATAECEDKHILEVMAKMQKRRERFKATTAPPKEEDSDNKDLLVVACGTDDIRNQRPARKRRWGGNG